MIFHVLNSGNAHNPIFLEDAEYDAFEKLMAETIEHVSMCLFGYCLMPDHWHLVLQPVDDGDLGRFMQRLSTTHVRRWHLRWQTVGGGHLYQGTYKSFPIEDDAHLLTVLRYVEGNPVRSTLVARAEHWRWSSLWRWLHPNDNEDRPALCRWPIARPADWKARVNRALAKKELDAVRVSVARGRPFGDEDWQRQTAKRLGLESTFRPRGRPRKDARDEPEGT
jgi:putative transposase